MLRKVKKELFYNFLFEVMKVFYKILFKSLTLSVPYVFKHNKMKLVVGNTQPTTMTSTFKILQIFSQDLHEACNHDSQWDDCL